MTNYRYYRCVDGRRFCRATKADLYCPFDCDDPALPESLLLAASQAGFDLSKLLCIHRYVDPEDGDSKRCAACGSKLRSRGYAVWAEEVTPDTEHDYLAPRYRVVGSVTYFGMKREAKEWCREQAEIADAIDDEPAALESLLGDIYKRADDPAEAGDSEQPEARK